MTRASLLEGEPQFCAINVGFQVLFYGSKSAKKSQVNLEEFGIQD